MKPVLALSFDIECYYQIVLKDYLGIAAEPTEEARRNTELVLDLLKKHGAVATFYFLGNIAEKFPNLVRRAVNDGHEIGVHGDKHNYINTLTPDQFRSEIAAALGKIRSAGASSITGHRAPAFSILDSNLWALDVLKEMGFQHDSSIMPFAGKRYGIAGWSKVPHIYKNGLLEVPLSVWEIAGRVIPCMGGGYVRLFPLTYTKYCARRVLSEGRIPVAYFHPYEFEATKPCIDAQLLKDATPEQTSKLRRMNWMQGIGRGEAMQAKLIWMLENFRTITVGALIGTVTQ